MSRTHTATFVISAGRCGTQWLADTLGRHYADLAEVRHEPIDHKYCPRLMLRSTAGLSGHPYRADVHRAEPPVELVPTRANLIL